ncbi:MAG TPA: hypothetical protein VIW70_03400 [Rubrivivax sp.]
MGKHGGIVGQSLRRRTEAKPALAAILLYVVIALLVSIPYVTWRKRRAVADTRGPAMTRDRQ